MNCLDLQDTSADTLLWEATMADVKPLMVMNEALLAKVKLGTASSEELKTLQAVMSLLEEEVNRRAPRGKRRAQLAHKIIKDESSPPAWTSGQEWYGKGTIERMRSEAEKEASLADAPLHSLRIVAAERQPERQEAERVAAAGRADLNAGHSERDILASARLAAAERASKQRDCDERQIAAAQAAERVASAERASKQRDRDEQQAAAARAAERVAAADRASRQREVDAKRQRDEQREREWKREEAARIAAEERRVAAERQQAEQKRREAARIADEERRLAAERRQAEQQRADQEYAMRLQEEERRGPRGHHQRPTDQPAPMQVDYSHSLTCDRCLVHFTDAASLQKHKSDWLSNVSSSDCALRARAQPYKDALLAAPAAGLPSGYHRGASAVNEVIWLQKLRQGISYLRTDYCCCTEITYESVERGYRRLRTYFKPNPVHVREQLDEGQVLAFLKEEEQRGFNVMSCLTGLKVII